MPEEEINLVVFDLFQVQSRTEAWRKDRLEDVGVPVRRGPLVVLRRTD